MAQQARREIENQYTLSMQRPLNIVLLHSFFQDARALYLVLEYCPKGNLYDELHKQPKQRFSEKKAAYYIRQIAKALKFTHSNNIIHRDVKLENLLLDVYKIPMLADFGWSICTDLSDNCKDFCGTLDYLPLEMIKQRSYSYGADIWSLGVLMFELLTGYAPFVAKKPAMTYKRILNRDYVIPDYVSDLAANVLKNIFVKESKRITLNELLASRWMSRYK